MQIPALWGQRVDIMEITHKNPQHWHDGANIEVSMRDGKSAESKTIALLYDSRG